MKVHEIIYHAEPGDSLNTCVAQLRRDHRSSDHAVTLIHNGTPYCILFSIGSAENQPIPQHPTRSTVDV